MTEYVTGYLFDLERREVALVCKNRPTRQAGKWNGVGGKVERKAANCQCYDVACDVAGFDPCRCPWETPLESMRREFAEKTGLDVQEWTYYYTLRGNGWQVHFFCAFERREVMESVRTVTDEAVRVWSLDGLLAVAAPEMVVNGKWLMEMARSMERSGRADSWLGRRLNMDAVLMDADMDPAETRGASGDVKGS